MSSLGGTIVCARTSPCTTHSESLQFNEKVNPTKVVDKLIDIAVTVIVPGRGAGENSWLMKNWRSIESSAEKASREMDIRSDLRRWDQQHPELHHELIVRYLAGVTASALVTAIFDLFRPRYRRY
jgi:hypothetical protein